MFLEVKDGLYVNIDYVQTIEFVQEEKDGTQTWRALLYFANGEYISTDDFLDKQALEDYLYLPIGQQ